MRPELYKRVYILEDRYWWFIGMRDIFYHSIKNIYKDKQNMCILDIGCGTGMVMKDLSMFGSVMGLDNEIIALRFCKKRGLSNLILGDGNYLPFKDKTFDLITVFNVIEHINNDVGLVEEIDRVGKDNSRVIMATSAFNFLWSKHDIVNEHKRRYSKGNLKNIIHKYFIIEKMTFTNCILFLLILAGIILNNLLKAKSCNPSDNLYPVPKSINKILIFILRLESIFLQKFNLPFGISLLCIAKKKNV